MAEPALRKLDRGLPRLEMRSPALIARQVTLGIARDVPAYRDGESLDRAEISAQAIIAEAKREACRILLDAQAAAASVHDLAQRNAAAIVAEARSTATAMLEAARNGCDMPGGRRPVGDIIRDVAERHGVHPCDITGVSRATRVVAARFAAIAESYVERPDLSMPALGRLFGGRDHTTILHAVRKAGVYRGAKK